ncbi:hypothetical protein D3C85_1355050 [compost metagenome]
MTQQVPKNLSCLVEWTFGYIKTQPYHCNYCQHQHRFEADPFASGAKYAKGNNCTPGNRHSNWKHHDQDNVLPKSSRCHQQEIENCND